MSNPTAPEHLIATSTTLGKIPSGVFILTVDTGTEQTGMIASWVQQVGFDPLTVAVALAPDRYAYQLIQRTGRFTLNMIGDGQYHLMKAFGKNPEEGFKQLAHTATQCGLHLHDAIGYMDCVVKTSVGGVTDHTVVLAEVVDGQWHNPSNLKPFTHIRKNGFSY